MRCVCSSNYLAGIVITALMLAACSTSDPPASEAISTTEAPTTTGTLTTSATPTLPALATAESALGTILTDNSGNTLYLFTPDTQGPSVCYDDCETSWPPLVGDVVAGDGVDPRLLGSEARRDGSAQVTYNGWPLYHFAADTAPGDIKGQNINGAWFVISPTGDPVGQDAKGQDGDDDEREDSSFSY